jgi:hypothetical protein
MISLKCQLRSLSITSAKCSAIMLLPSVSDSEIAVLEPIIFYFRDASVTRFLVLFCFWSRDIRENVLTADYDHLHRGMFRFTVRNYRSIAIHMLENSDLMGNINFRKQSALMLVKLCCFMTKTKQTLLN